MSLARRIEPELAKAARHFPAVLLTGPRRAGKTTLFRRAFPRASYHLLEDPDTIARVQADPRGFLAAVRTPVILDEIQHAPELFNYVRTLIDRAPRKMGQWLLTGSQDAPLMRGVTESMAGRVAVLHLLPFSVQESSKVSLLRGGFPEVLARPAARALWFRSYVQTYLERDVRAVTGVRDLATFRRFLGLVASRVGQTLNKTDLAAPLGVSVPTIGAWLDVLEVTGQILLVPPYYSNFGKRLIKAPKLHFADSGFACHLLGIESEAALGRSPFLGSLFEGFVASEIAKQQINLGRARDLYYFRDQQGLEVDFVVPLGERRLALVEAKASATARPEMAQNVSRLLDAAGDRETQGFLVYRPVEDDPAFTALRPGIEALGIDGLLARLAPSRSRSRR